MATVFISYNAEADEAAARRLAADLRAADLDVWMASESIRAGESFPAAIDRGLEGSEFVIVLLSPSALASDWVRAEVYAALDRAHQGLTTLIPARLQPVALPPLLSGFQWVDFSQYEQGLTVLGTLLRVQIRPVSDVPTVEPGRSRLDVSPPDAFTARALGALEAGAMGAGYAILRTNPATGGSLDAVIEVALLRIGVMVQRRPAAVGELLGRVERELGVNPHRVAAILAIAPGDETTLQEYQLREAATPNAVVMTWAPTTGMDAVPAAVPLVVGLMTGGVPADITGSHQPFGDGAHAQHME
ncbi:toll/interleukin-1 receptor domain-containing protein [Pedococcus sp. 5OH_020]|uniref:toll/interleukin-1 receptor domain-containing protein n=1 Tax=Pedococcus sp. 5OH_020 TaxID=2989814 RepID=UPI0022E9C2F5|nr:toll/interleukin-1 receptor domain-containing protein [Pedococcus sp. 5OH_020]